MPVKIVVDEDIFSLDVEARVNPVNTSGAMGRGLALEFKKRYPDMYEAYRELCRNGKLTIGVLHFYKTKDGIVINFPTKVHWKFDSKMEYIEAGLQKFLHLEKTGFLSFKSVAFPLLGTGLGGLDRQEVLDLMTSYLNKSNLDIYITTR